MAQKVGRNARGDRKDGQGGGGMSLGNPGEERRLAATLSKIDREKRKREMAMSWNQRSFFMKQVFDQDNELRFVKAAQRPKYLNRIPPPPREGDNSWMKDEYVFSFKPRTSTIPECKDFVRNHEEGPLAESPKALGFDEGASADQPPLEENGESKPDGQESVAATAKENKEAERQKNEKEKRDLASRGVFGARREKMKMPLLMSGAWQQKTEPEVKPDEVVEDIPDDHKVTTEAEAEESKDTAKEADPLNQSKSSSSGTTKAVKPKTRFPVLKVRALGLFAMTFKKSASVPPLQSQSQLPSQSTNDLKLSPIPNPEKDASVLTASFPPQTAPNMTVKARSPPHASPGASELERPGSVSLPNSPMLDRKPQLVRQQSDHSILMKSTERPKTDRSKRSVHPSESGNSRSRRGSRRDGTAKSNPERSKRHSESSVKSIKSASAAMPKSKRDGTTKTNLSSSVPDGLGRDSKHIWGAICENENQDAEHKDNGGIDGKDEEDVSYHVIRRIVRTLPAHLMLKTSKREVEAGGDVALLRQKMMDLARADTTRRASLDPRFKKLEKSLCNSP